MQCIFYGVKKQLQIWWSSHLKRIWFFGSSNRLSLRNWHKICSSSQHQTDCPLNAIQQGKKSIRQGKCRCQLEGNYTVTSAKRISFELSDWNSILWSRFFVSLSYTSYVFLKKCFLPCISRISNAFRNEWFCNQETEVLQHLKALAFFHINILTFLISRKRTVQFAFVKSFQIDLCSERAKQIQSIIQKGLTKQQVFTARIPPKIFYTFKHNWKVGLKKHYRKNVPEG